MLLCPKGHGMGSPVHTGLTYQTHCQGFAVGYKRLRHLGLNMFYDETQESDTWVWLTCGGRSSSEKFSTYTWFLPLLLILRNYCPQVPPDSHGMPDQLSSQALCQKHLNLEKGGGGRDVFHVTKNNPLPLNLPIKTCERRRRKRGFLAYLGQVSELVGIQQKLLQTPTVAIYFIGHVQQGAVAFIDHLDMTVAPPQGYTVKHDGGGGDKSRTPVR